MTNPAEAARTAWLDQIGSATRDIAALLHSYYTALRKAGFGRWQAMRLTSEYQTTLLTVAVVIPRKL